MFMCAISPWGWFLLGGACTLLFLGFLGILILLWLWWRFYMWPL